MKREAIKRMRRSNIRLLTRFLRRHEEGPTPTDVFPNPGWYPDPNDPGELRWFDGIDWTTHHERGPTE